MCVCVCAVLLPVPFLSIELSDNLREQTVTQSGSEGLNILVPLAT